MIVWRLIRIVLGLYMPESSSGAALIAKVGSSHLRLMYFTAEAYSMHEIQMILIENDFGFIAWYNLDTI